MAGFADNLPGPFCILYFVYHSFFIFQILIDGKEVAHLREDMSRQLVDILIGAIGRIIEGNGNDLFVQLAGIQHIHYSDRVAANHAQGMDGFAAKNQYI
ncbi:hypothetical protein SDC9_180687 [bioreactor metagenome]|uniref:Uncharacterized protein n=1 Tax=bioreactor metagenome TaxID=1076179 RepID=A0A645HBM4_9ZZZZ